MTRVIHAAGPEAVHPAAGRLSPLVWIYFATILLPVTMNIGPLALTSLRLLCLGAVLPLLVGALTGRFGKTILADWMALLHLGWMALTLFRTEGSGAIQLTGSMGIEFLGGYLIARATIRDLATFQSFCKLMVGAVLLLLPFALFEAAKGVPLLPSLLAKLPAFGSVEDVQADKRLGLHRVQAVFAHPIHFGLFASVSFALCWSALEGVLSTFARLCLAFAVAATGFLSLSSGGILAIALQVALIGWAMALPSRLPRWWFLLGLFLLAYILVDILSNRTPLHVFMSYATFSAHTAYWRLLIFDFGMDNVWANPLFGIGMGDWERPAWMHTPSVDNFWLLHAMRHGIPGFLTLAACWIAVILPALRRPLNGDSPMGRARRAWIFSILGLSLTLLTVHVWGNAYSFVMFLLGAGAWLTYAQEGEAVRGPAQPTRREPLRHSRFPAPIRTARA